MSARRIHLVFKTHLDIGFTDHAARVRAQYHQRFIPQAIDTGEHFLAENPADPAFAWTTGAWLIWDHLATQDADKVKRLERAIERGLIRWHALPFTTHSELMSPDLFRAGLSYAQQLDRRFGVATSAAKMTDVPGHTLGIVPLLAEAGVRFLHLGVNAASPVPDVPELFRWRAPDGTEVVVMYQPSYGATHFPAGFDDGIGFAHTSDNMGPQSVPQVAEIHRELRHAQPGAAVHASTLDEYGEIVWARRAHLPVVETEIGDSWIYGSASDPGKTRRFLALQRLYDELAADRLTPARQAFGRGLALVAEHTCGVDIKSYLRDETAWDRPAFEALRRRDYRFAYTEASWAEQRAYLDAATAALEPADRARADAATAALAAAPIDAPGGWRIEIDPASGDIASVTSPSGTRLAGVGGSLFGYRYESYDAGDVDMWMDGYLTTRPDWAILDHGKPGLDHAATAMSRAYATTMENGVRVVDAEAHARLGAPARIEFACRGIDETTLEIAVTLIDKPANRMPEASFFTFTPEGEGAWQVLKTGLWLDPATSAPRGGGQLQAVAAVRRGSLELRPLDTPLAAPAEAAFMAFHPQPPSWSGGLRFNLHNNKWGTNFPMWWGAERFTARFRLTLR
ncbi:MAG: DUF5054 domain-containing protein [Devosia sp. 67-54]|uniref:DUF5054 domain-containing protein n=1 Tax=unclassified Devosia TaxID=196773 RepID=UPI0009624F3F|nr:MULTISPECIES: DUF5054 domain-containing protein [unclassified Devosia]MBN9305573.1 DUF5054 domain-containing protein [Devosia sp.]OJX19150.1 MAG: DUF5054 domain-containing protein [Devosia sp. 67-54]